ncbi:Transposable element tcb2 transposase [Caligus rogercresseyi]|uniref:Transposable element tcb2 transposase n=1 Tax=Caligus rogercresseyi TaxID=217165 RepID=A0A7T8HK15_CALRO|nr:Transposable element tcb2 transposase [Caligus rogercresseyi]
MEEEKRHAMFASFRVGRSPKEVIEFFNYPKSTVYDQTDEFVAKVKSKVNEDGNKSYAKLQPLQGDSSYKKRHRMILTEGTRESRRVKAAALLNNLKHETAGLLRFFSDDNFFSQDQNSNRQNDRWICQNVDEVPVVKHTKFPSSVMVLGVISSEG